jgi:hypothetical protein
MRGTVIAVCMGQKVELAEIAGRVPLGTEQIGECRDLLRQRDPVVVDPEL